MMMLLPRGSFFVYIWFTIVVFLGQAYTIVVHIQRQSSKLFHCHVSYIQLSTMSLFFSPDSIEHLVVQQTSRKIQFLFVLVMKFQGVLLKGKELGLSTSTLAVNFTRVYADGLCAYDYVRRHSYVSWYSLSWRFRTKTELIIGSSRLSSKKNLYYQKQSNRLVFKMSSLPNRILSSSRSSPPCSFPPVSPNRY